MTAAQITAAVDVLRAGGLVAFPTETVYGLGADASNAAAVRGIFTAKGRPADHPLIVHVAAADMLPQWAREIPVEVEQLAAAFWPGPLTIILERRGDVPAEVSGGLSTIGLRVPRHPVALALLKVFGGGIAAPSANKFGRVSPTRAEHVRDEFSPGELPVILAGGDCEVGLESTIIDLSRGRPMILRPGAITAEQVEAVLRTKLALPDEHAPRVSGSLESHYAPHAAVELLRQDELVARCSAALNAGRKPVVIAAETIPLPRDVRTLPAPSDPQAFAHRLYDLLRTADRLGDVLLIVPPAEIGIGLAIWDRLRKAAAPRPTA